MLAWLRAVARRMNESLCPRLEHTTLPHTQCERDGLREREGDGVNICRCHRRHNSNINISGSSNMIRCSSLATILQACLIPSTVGPNIIKRVINKLHCNIKISVCIKLPLKIYKAIIPIPVS